MIKKNRTYLGEIKDSEDMEKNYQYLTKLNMYLMFVCLSVFKIKNAWRTGVTNVLADEQNSVLKKTFLTEKLRSKGLWTICFYCAEKFKIPKVS